MTVQKAISHLKILIEHRQKVLNMMKGHVGKMQSDAGKDLGNTLVEATESDLAHLQQILAELQPKHRKTNTAQKD